ncbi:hypothetical protein Acr_19g0001070 [Actinidia rufa]|uniref:Uncharacterized protein n=1 Tax=Actinidia rufa TaxID=165716 RepID=A0A7J0G8P3_9ERIC|nr:hypothetical protein Acr_19g0001070 [Actinidia rufa]
MDVGLEFYRLKMWALLTLKGLYKDNITVLGRGVLRSQGVLRQNWCAFRWEYNVMEYHMKLDLLTQDCITSIPSLTTPHDASNSSLVSSVVCAAAEPDILWESFAVRLSRLASSVLFRSKK